MSAFTDAPTCFDTLLAIYGYFYPLKNFRNNKRLRCRRGTARRLVALADFVKLLLSYRIVITLAVVNVSTKLAVLALNVEWSQIFKK